MACSSKKLYTVLVMGSLKPSSQEFIDHDGLFPPEVMEKISGYSRNIIQARARGKDFDAVAEARTVKWDLDWLFSERLAPEQMPKEARELFHLVRDLNSEYRMLMER